MTTAPKRNHGTGPSRPNIWGKRLTSLGLTVVLGLFVNSQAAAQALNGAAVRNLALRGIWLAEFPEYGNWSWHEDNTVCLRLGDTKGKCADTGTWEIKDSVLCYEFTWWGDTVGDRKNCFTVQAHENGRYETLYHGGAMVSTMYFFTVLE